MLGRYYTHSVLADVHQTTRVCLVASGNIVPLLSEKIGIDAECLMLPGLVEKRRKERELCWRYWWAGWELCGVAQGARGASWSLVLCQWGIKVQCVEV